MAYVHPLYGDVVRSVDHGANGSYPISQNGGTMPLFSVVAVVTHLAASYCVKRMHA